MEAAVATSTRAPLPFPLLPTAGRPVVPSGLQARPRRGLASISATSAFGGGGGGRISGGGGGGGGGGGDDSGAGAAAAAAAVAALGEAEAQQQADIGDSDAIVLHVGGMSCGGCAGKVKRILESQPEVAAATVDVEKAMALVWATPDAKATKDWQKELAEKLANHLTSCGFESHPQAVNDEGKAEQTDS